MFAAIMMAASLQAAATPESEIAAVLDRLNAASAAADTEAYFALYTPEARFVGTDAGEHWTVEQLRAFAKPYFDTGQGWSYPATARTITLAPIDCRCIAWFEEKLTNETYGRTRGSGVMRLTDGGWKIEQYVLSLAVPNDLASPLARIIATYEAKAEAVAAVPTP
ncbi:protein with SnoaL 3 domain, NTF 2 superfamily [Brevundimonas sp. LM2]|uniref:nuclear transport factor 2 family protein n=1 Tax=Brevundimonas sp. LM2 TaxID=1938605 RepID=UPI000984025A|nr:nuclear transport factor 2 family protein [Brevundimonas sp. LM2]AQR61933.1 protein with SnoaL 3 domain, NTF 2 superfamily [Brevundimonas sp. LM2]